MSVSTDLDKTIAGNPDLFGTGQSMAAAFSLFGSGNMAGIPSLSAPGGSAGPAVSGGGDVYHGDVKSGVNVFVVIGVVFVTAIFVWKAARK